MRGGNESRDPSRTAIPPIAGLNAMKLFLQYQASMLRIFAVSWRPTTATEASRRSGLRRNPSLRQNSDEKRPDYPAQAQR
jgi:hypothetical protein